LDPLLLVLFGIVFVYVSASNSTILLQNKLIKKSRTEDAAPMNGKQFRFMWCLYAIMAIGFYILLVKMSIF